MHWHSFNNAVCLLNKAISRVFRSIMNFKNFENHVDFVCRPASQPAVRLSCARCRAVKITQNRLLCRIYETVVPKTISYCTMVILLSFLTLLSSLSIGMHKQLASRPSPQHSIHGVNREVNAPAVL